jgi:ankyrin repeat protein
MRVGVVINQTLDSLIGSVSSENPSPEQDVAQGSMENLRHDYLEMLCTEVVNKSWHTVLPYFEEPMSTKHAVRPIHTIEATNGQNLLVAAAIVGSQELVKRLVLDGVVDEFTYFGTALEAAAVRGDAATVGMILYSTPPDRIAYSNRISALLGAARSGHVPVLQVLLSAPYIQHPMAPPTPPYPFSEYMHRDSTNVLTAITQAAQNCQAPVIEFLAATFPTVLYDTRAPPTVFGRPPIRKDFQSNLLFYSAAKGNLALLKQCLDEGINPNERQNKWSSLPFHKAIQAGHLSVAVELYKYRPQLTQDDFVDMITNSVRNGRVGIVEYLIRIWHEERRFQQKVSLAKILSGHPKGREPSTLNLLRLSVKMGHPGMVRLLLQHGMSVPKSQEDRTEWLIGAIEDREVSDLVNGKV